MAALFVALALTPTGHAAGIRLEISGPAVPYETVTYAIERKRGTVVVTVSKRFARPFGGRDEVGLLTEEAWTAFTKAMDRRNVFTLPSVARPGARATVRLKVEWAGRTHRFTVDDPSRLLDRRYAAVIDLVRGLAHDRVGPVEFRDVMLLASEAGRLRVVSDPRATVTLDGVPLGLKTPVFGIRVAAGSHELRLTPLRGGPVYPYSVKVEPGKTTLLSVELK